MISTRSARPSDDHLISRSFYTIQSRFFVKASHKNRKGVERLLGAARALSKQTFKTEDWFFHRALETEALQLSLDCALALQILEEASAKANEHVASAYIALRLPAKAIAVYREFINKFPAEVPTRFKLIDLLRGEELDEWYTLAKETAARFPDNTWAQIYGAGADSRRDKVQKKAALEAIRTLDRAAKLTDARMLEVAGTILRRSGDPKGALDLFKRALGLARSASSRAELLLQLGETLERKSPRLALRYYEDARKEQPKDSHVLAHVATCQLHLRNIPAAEKALLQIPEGSEFEATASANLAVIAQRRDDHATATRHFNAALRRRPLEPDLILGKARSEIALGKYWVAMSTLKKIAAGDEASLAEKATLEAIALWATGNIADARDQLNPLCSIPHATLQALRNRALLDIALHDYASGLTDFDRVLARAESDRLARTGRVRCLIGLGRYSDARDDAIGLVESDEHDADGWLLAGVATQHLADALQDDDLHDEAVGLCDRALAERLRETDWVTRVASEGEIRSVRAASYTAQRKYNMAIRDIRRVLEIAAALKLTTARAELNLRRLKRAVNSFDLVPSYVPMVVGISAFVLVASAVALLWLAKLTAPAFASVVIAAMALYPISYLLPSSSKFKIAGIELERAALAVPKLDLQDAMRFDFFDAHFVKIRPVERPMGRQLLSVRPVVREARLWRVVTGSIAARDASEIQRLTP